MRILKSSPKIRKVEKIEDEGDFYIRKEYIDGSVIWAPISYDGEEEGPEGSLENKYKKLITNETNKQNTGN